MKSESLLYPQMDRTNIFFTACRQKWDNKYDYSASIFTNESAKISIKCIEHDVIFEQKAQNHKRGVIGCPACKSTRSKEAGRGQTSMVRAAPQLLLEIDYVATNLTIEQINSLSKGSREELPWICDQGHKWKAKVKDRVGSCNAKGTGCPECCGRQIGLDNNLLAKFPEIAAEWSVRNDTTPDKVASVGSYNAYWNCPICLREYQMQVRKRTHENRQSACPYCAHRRVADENLLTVKFPLIAAEYDHDLNDKPITEITYGSSYIAAWICSHGEPFNARVCDRTSGNIRCPCESGATYSQAAIDWMKSIELAENIQIQHAKNGGEFVIPGTKYRVDGYHAATNRVFEYHGDFWHGNPLKHRRDDVNAVNGKTFGELYDKTVAREEKIRSLGYVLVTMWESEWLGK